MKSQFRGELIMNERRWTDHQMLRFHEGWGLVVFLALASSCFATSQHEVFTNAVPFYSDSKDQEYPSIKDVRGLHLDTATLDNPSAARDLVMKMRAVQEKSNKASCPLSPDEDKQTGKSKRDPYCLPLVDGQHSDNYVLIHLLRWAGTPDKPTDKPKVEADHWYLYRDVTVGNWSQEDFTNAKRLMGVKRLYVLLVQLNAKVTGLAPNYTVAYTPNYDFTVTKKTPANVGHLYALLQAYAGGASAGQGAGQPLSGKALEALGKPSIPPPPDAVWSGGVINLQYRPSDILIKSTFRPNPGDTDQKLADDITFDNEGAYYWDVGFAIPVRKISELKLDTTSGTATPAKVNSQNVFAVLDGYPFKPVDVKGSGFNAIPHPIAGVAFAKQPLSKILIGGAWGPKASELYLGAMFVKQPELSGSSSCSNPSGTSLTGKSHYCAQFTIGINLSVSAIASKLGAPK